MGPSSGATDRLDVWRDLIRENFVALDIDADRSGPFTGAVRSTEVGHLRVATADSTTAGYRRTPGLARRDDDVYLQVGLLARGEGLLRQDGRDAVLRPGDYAVYETDRPFFWGLRGDCSLLVLTWPRATVALAPGESRRYTARTLDGARGLGGIVGRMLRDLVTAPPTLTPAGGARLADEVAQLVTTVAAEHAGPPPAGPAAADLLARIDAYIAEHLADPDLGPAAVAAAHFISTRQLHRLFAARGDTVTRSIRRQRLEGCRRELAGGHAGAPITEISRRWGFTDLSTFSRAFGAAYGTSPSGYRARYLTRR